MRRIYGFTLAVTALLVAGSAQAQEDANRVVTDGGIKVAGWQATLDAADVTKGATIQQSKLTKVGDALHVMTGPAITYFNPANKASGNYTVKATFHEPKYMSLNNHPHPYGIVIAGNDMGTPERTYLYCAAYGSGTFIVRGMGPAPFTVSARRPEANEAVNKAAGPGQPVTQEIAVTVHGDKVDCSVNGKVVGSYNKADLVAAGKLKSLDGVYGIRFAHNTEGTVTGLTMTKH
jgi:hypothetical protein